MSSLLVGLALLLTQQSTEKALRVELLGRPVVKHTMLLSQPHYFGNDMQLTQEVRVVDEDNRPVSGQTVTFMARTRDGRVSRIRAHGLTNTAGHAVVIGFIDV